MRLTYTKSKVGATEFHVQIRLSSTSAPEEQMLNTYGTALNGILRKLGISLEDLRKGTPKSFTSPHEGDKFTEDLKFVCNEISQYLLAAERYEKPSSEDIEIPTGPQSLML